MFSPNSHADVFISRLLDGYRLNGTWHSPRLQTRQLLRRSIPVQSTWPGSRRPSTGSASAFTVAEAIAGVDGIAVIGEHGHYPRTPRGNFMYPRKRYFDEIMRVFESQRRGRSAVERQVPGLRSGRREVPWPTASARSRSRLPAARLSLSLAAAGPRSSVGAEVRRIPRGQLQRSRRACLSCDRIAAIGRGTPRRDGCRTVRYAEGDRRLGKISPNLLDAALATRVNPPPEDHRPEARSVPDPLPRWSGGFRPQPELQDSRSILWPLARRSGNRPRKLFLYLAVRTLSLGFHGAGV